MYQRNVIFLHATCMNLIGSLIHNTSFVDCNNYSQCIFSHGHILMAQDVINCHIAKHNSSSLGVYMSMTFPKCRMHYILPKFYNEY